MEINFQPIKLWTKSLWSQIVNLFKPADVPSPIIFPSVPVLEAVTLLEARGETWHARVTHNPNGFIGTVKWQDGSSETFNGSSAAQVFLTCVNFGNQNPRPGRPTNFTMGLALKNRL